MKFYTHPKRKQTLIQRKDGRTYEKSWVYFRTLLRTENDEKKFTFLKAQESILNSIQAQTSGQSTVCTIGRDKETKSNL